MLARGLVITATVQDLHRRPGSAGGFLRLHLAASFIARAAAFLHSGCAVTTAVATVGRFTVTSGTVGGVAVGRFTVTSGTVGGVAVGRFTVTSGTVGGVAVGRFTVTSGTVGAVVTIAIGGGSLAPATGRGVVVVFPGADDVHGQTGVDQPHQ